MIEIHPEITREKYDKLRAEIADEIQHEKPFVFFENVPEAYPKIVSLKLVARHVAQSDAEVVDFVRRHQKQILSFLTINPLSPPHWTDKEILSYAAIVIGVMNIYRTLENIG